MDPLNLTINLVFIACSLGTLAVSLLNRRKLKNVERLVEDRLVSERQRYWQEADERKKQKDLRELAAQRIVDRELRRMELEDGAASAGRAGEAS